MRNILTILMRNFLPKSSHFTRLGQILAEIFDVSFELSEGQTLILSRNGGPKKYPNTPSWHPLTDLHRIGGLERIAIQTGKKAGQTEKKFLRERLKKTSLNNQ